MVAIAFSKLIGPVPISVFVSEKHNTRLGITEIPVETGVKITDMWKAAGSEDSKRPANWARKEGAPFIEAVSLSLDMPVGHIYKTKRGGRGVGGETFANWQIGLAYAKYLNHEFHMWCNAVVRSHMEGRAVATAHNLTDYDKQIIGKKLLQSIVR